MSEEKKDNTSVSWCSDSKITKYTHTWAVQNFSFCKSDQMVSSRFDPHGTRDLIWYYRLNPNFVYKEKYLHVRLELVVERCNVSVQFIVRTTVHNTQSSKICQERAVKVEPGSVICCMSTARDGFFSGNSITFSFEVVVVEQYKCQEAPNMQIIQPQSMLLENFAHLLEDKEFCDLKVVVGDKEFDGHKAILAVRSSVFRAMFKNDMVESKQNKVTINDIEPKVFEELLRFIYTDSVQNIDTNALELLQAADKYDLDKLKAMCEKALCATISEKTAIEMLITADLYRAHQLRRATISYIERNGNVLNSEDWKSLWKTNFDLANQTVSEILKLKS